jgi:hopanoid biosynthesis associated protein HpnK
MNEPSLRRRLIVNADDFGRSPGINEAVARAHKEGILTTASLMVNEPHCDEAVRIAQQNPRLGVGLHLALTRGRAGLEPNLIPGLANASGAFRGGPIATGFRCYFRPSLRSQFRSEIHEQFRRFHATGLRLDHVNGHLHLHMHPTVLSILLEDAKDLGITAMRAGTDPLGLNLRLAKGRRCYRLSHALIFGLLAARARRKIRGRGIPHAPRVFGLLQDGRMDEPFVRKLLANLPEGDSELYSHPCVETCGHELDALTSPAVRDLIKQQAIELVRYQDL